MITLYDAPRCPYCARVRIVLAEKGIDYETVEIDLANRPDWLYEKNPVGKVPVFEDGAFVLPESEVIMEYLEERHPEPALLPSGPPERALVRLVIERFDVNLGDAYYAFRAENEDGAEWLAHCLSFFERNAGRWPERYSLAEIAYVPWLIRLRDLFGFDLSPYPTLLDRLEQLCERPAVAAEVDVVAALAR
jgi:RNA polymerase-associated protein